MKVGEARVLVRSAINESRRMRALQSSQVNEITLWLSGHLAKTESGVGQAYLFGSVIHRDYPTSDVDVALLFNDMADKEYTRKERRLAPVSRDFEKTFQKPLHFQRFLATEVEAFREFISKQSEPVLVISDE